MASVYIINSNKEREPFSLKKVYRSAKRVGAPKELAEKIARTIEKEAYPGITTLEIFKRVKKLLQQKIPKAALKFNLKKGIKKLGPTGFPFEKYVGAIFSRNDFEVKLNQHIPGFCCRYEIDFVAKKDDLLYVGECKYHNLPGAKVHSNTSLANYARFLDIKKGKFFNKNNYKNLSPHTKRGQGAKGAKIGGASSRYSVGVKIKSLIVTNTKFTTKSISYSNCVGVELLGWNYPRNGGLEYLIDSQKLYPITILPSLNRYLAEIFASKRIMLAQDVLRIDVVKFAKETKISKQRLKLLIKEAETLLL